MSDDRIFSIIKELEDLVPKDTKAQVHITNPIESAVAISATREGFVRLGIQFLKAAVCPLREVPAGGANIESVDEVTYTEESACEIVPYERTDKPRDVDAVTTIPYTKRGEIFGWMTCGILAIAIAGILFLAAFGTMKLIGE